MDVLKRHKFPDHWLRKVHEAVEWTWTPLCTLPALVQEEPGTLDEQ
jgi:hypothetical protein